MTRQPQTQPPDRLIRHPSQTPLDELCINTIRCLAMDAVQAARSGHPGMPMGMASAAYVLWTRHLRFNPLAPGWPDRDRFVLSAGHGCMLLYALLHLAGYDVTLEDLRRFRQWGSVTPGHPEFGHTPGVEATTGPLGQGIGNAVGMALAAKHLGASFNRERFPLFTHRVFVIAGDGCLQEGVAAEACSLAGHLGLDNLIVLYDDNRITIDGPTSLSFSEDVARRFASYGWHVQSVDRDAGNDLESVDRAIAAAKAVQDRPSIILLRTLIGFGSPNKENSHEAHGSPLGEEEVRLTKQRYGWDPGLSFHVPPEVRAAFRAVAERGRGLEEEWRRRVDAYRTAHPEEAALLEDRVRGPLPRDWDRLWQERVPTFAGSAPMATREAQGRILDAVMPVLPCVLGGSADLTPSNNTRFAGAEDFSRSNRVGRYIRYGVREHAMGAMMNGMASGGMVIPYGGTFFCFSDYMRPAVRLAALSGHHVIFSFTHDSIGLGEDGPTHQPVEHLAALRAVPGLIVIRPADAEETAFAWKFALDHGAGPTALVLTRQKVPSLDRSGTVDGPERGAYVLRSDPDPEVIFLATGSEVHLAVAAGAHLAKAGRSVRVVNMPSWELFERQPAAYRDSVIPPHVRPRVGVEAGVRLGWDRWLGEGGEFVGLHGFGASAPADVAFREFGITVDAVVAAAERLL